MIDELQKLKTAVADRYAVVRQLGAGGMATVYLADDLKHRRQIAIKVVRSELAAAIGAERFLTEIRVTAALQHPNILPLYDSGEADGLLYYVMPLMEGESLRDRLRREKLLPVDQAVAILRSVGEALDYAHSRGVIHRDIKPENILLQHGQALVADFGIALAGTIAPAGGVTETGVAIGTPHYMSPEQALGDRTVDARSDVYALGTMLYEMLAGHLPFAAATPQGVIAKIISEPVPTLRADRPAVPPNIDGAIEVALEKLPVDRFRTAREFVDALGNPNYRSPRQLAGSGGARPARWTDRMALPAMAVALASLALAGWAVLKTDPPPAAQTLRYRISLPPQQLLTTRYASRVVLSPDGSRLVYMGPSPQGVQLWVRRRDQLEGTPIPGTEAAAAPFFSPDGQRVGFLNVGRQSLHAVALDGGAFTTLVAGDVRRVGASWGEDGIVYVDDKRGLVRVQEGESAAQAAVLLGLDRVADPRWPHALPAGKGVLFTRPVEGRPGELEIAALPGAGGEPRTLVRGIVGFYADSGHLLYVTSASELMAVPFDLDRLERSGTPVTVARDIELQFGAADVTISRRGTLIYGAAGAERNLAELVSTDRTGTTRALDTQWRADFQAVAISPDGKQVAATVIDGEQMDVWIKPLAGGQATRLSLGSEGRSFRATWHPTGRLVGFIVERGDTRQFFQRQADGSGGTVLGFSESVNQAVWSNDGNWLIYRTGRVDDLSIYARRLDNGTTIKLATQANANEHSPALSPDNRWLAFVSNRSGQWEVYVKPFPAAADGEWQVSVGGGTEPRWSHSGRELFYKQGGQLMAAEVVPGATFAIGNRRPLFSLDGYYNFAFHPTYDVAPDDQHFVMIRSRYFGESFDLVVIEHWDQEVAATR